MKQQRSVLLVVVLMALLMARGGMADDKAALLAFKRRMTNDPNGALSTWEAASPICSSFAHVTCNGDLRVIVLDLSGLGLTGTVAPELGNLEHLQTLSLSKNHLFGPIPGTLSQIKPLTTLDLSHNQLFGNIPCKFDNFGASAALRVL
ncbi:hypothetical protein L7F22_014394 [Adiantum nelumboides]|nr:hypothetical protein [Adiantum nelumboides]